MNLVAFPHCRKSNSIRNPAQQAWIHHRSEICVGNRDDLCRRKPTSLGNCFPLYEERCFSESTEEFFLVFKSSFVPFIFDVLVFVNLSNTSPTRGGEV
jgi:hypothetical protein